jgi:hypothetical protein
MAATTIPRRAFVVVLGLFAAVLLLVNRPQPLPSAVKLPPRPRLRPRTPLHGHGRRKELGSIILESFALTADQARHVLATDSGDPTSVFGSVDVSLELSPRYLSVAQNQHERDQLMKTFVGSEVFEDRGCVVFAAGIADTLKWEAAMAALGCIVHAFDCTSDVAKMGTEAAATGVVFHPWCIGTRSSFGQSRYASAADNSTYVFRTLSEVMDLLGFARVDILKFDIEGFEWELFEGSLLPAATAQAGPQQLLFELHTEGANPEFVPQHLVKGRGRLAVNSLFMALHDAGYRVVAKEVNPGDPACAEFSVALYGGIRPALTAAVRASL